MDPLEVSITIRGYGRTIRINDMVLSSIGVQLECLTNVTAVMESYANYADSQEGADFARVAEAARKKMRQVSLLRLKCKKEQRKAEENAARQYHVLQTIDSEEEAVMPNMTLPDMQDMTESELAFMMEPEVPDMSEAETESRAPEPESQAPNAAASASVEGAADHEAQAVSEKVIETTETLPQQPQQQQQKVKDAVHEGRSRWGWSWNLRLPQFKVRDSTAKVAPSGSASAPPSSKDQVGTQTFTPIAGIVQRP
eukprot:TRINITY_DN18750_c0_g2_i1.p1 TRINITY_DN18750_c0_g2~~TRINITY_DN18750_c0_g2_i1.p1  ORF type:complete len:254 (+),score=51.09 TRINITY_DN18750_c0_g2_i1:87-848(+)